MAITSGKGRPIDSAAYDETAARIRRINEHLLATFTNAGTTLLDAYESTLRNLAAFEESVAGATQLEWVAALAQAHAAMVRDVVAIYTRAARDLIG